MFNFYNNNGYIVLPTLFSEEEKKKLVEYVTEIESWEETKGKWMKYYELNKDTNEKQLCRTEHFLPYHSKLNDILKSNKVMNTLEHLLGHPVYIYKDKINFKYSGGNGFLPHQDAPAFVGQGQLNHITMSISIDKTTKENGCLEFAINKKDIWKNKISLDTNNNGCIKDISEFEWLPIESEPGDVVVFGSYIPHKSGPNNTNNSRRTLYLTYNPVSEGDRYFEYNIDKRKHFPPEIERIPNTDYSQGEKVYNVANPII
jgi:ectoine hydroxylase-related dioxygenase (phytanoyl-CoA dioxygenase family)